MKFILKCGLVLLFLHALTSQATLTVTNIATGCMALDSIFVTSDGSLWTVGYNAWGELGNGAYYRTNRPQQIVTNDVTAVAAGQYHTLFVKTDGSLWAMGWNGMGQLGDNGDFHHSTNRPELIVSHGVTTVAVGGDHSLFLKSDGSLWAMGFDFAGQLGDGQFLSGTPGGVNYPQEIITGGVTAIAGGAYHSLFLKSDGSLWGMGQNTGCLGDGTFERAGRPEQIVTNGVTAVAGGGYHSLFLKSDGSLWVMGFNDYGALGDGTSNDTNLPERIVAGGVTAIAAGNYHSLFLKSDGSLWVMGDNRYGQLGDGTLNSTNVPERIVASGVTAIAAGNDHSLFLKSDGSLWAMGEIIMANLATGSQMALVCIPNKSFLRHHRYWQQGGLIKQL